MKTKEILRQASHFDETPPFIPGAWFLRENGYRYQYILKDLVIAKSMEGMNLKPFSRILDVGCSDGVFLDRIVTSYDVYGFGVDISSASIRRGWLESINHIHMAQADIEMVPFPSNFFDLITSFDVLEHVQYPDHAIEEMVRVIRPGGKVFCYAVSKRNRYTFNWFITSILDRFRIDHWSRGCHDADLLVDPEMVYTKLIELGCEVDKLEPFHAFFTILFDQALLGFYWICTKFGILRPRRSRRNIFTQLLFKSMHWLCHALITPLSKLDVPWVNHCLSNGFFIVATKP